jgi:hypothetical protein
LIGHIDEGGKGAEEKAAAGFFGQGKRIWRGIGVGVYPLDGGGEALLPEQ